MRSSPAEMSRKVNGNVVGLYEEASASLAAQTLMSAVGPQIDRRLEILINQLVMAPAELGPLLDLRAKLSAVWYMRKSLKDMATKGQSAVEAFNQMLSNSEGE